MISGDPRLPQFLPDERESDALGQAFWARFQSRFYTLWRELASSLAQMVRAPESSVDTQVARFDGTSGRVLTGSDVYVTDDGRLYGAALHNNAGAVTGTTNQYVASGTYTPSLTNVTNLTSTTAYLCQWLRVGNVVTVSGRVDIDAVDGALAVTFRMSLPIASNFTATNHCGGVGRSGGVTGAELSISANTANDAALFDGNPGSANAENVYFSFTYLIA